MRLRLGAAIAVSALVVASLAVGSASAAPAQPEGANRIAIIDFDYRPDPNTVAPGTRIRVGNADGYQNGIPHSLTSEDGRFDTGVFVCCVRRIVAPTTPGTYPYFCEVHSQMGGTLIVSP
jgi:plastocyanin